MEPKGKDNEKIADRWLDSALRQYGGAELRTGLEGRVLANLRGERDRRTAPRNWWPAFVAVAAIVAAGATIFSVRTHDVAKHIVVAKHEVQAVRKAADSPGLTHRPITASAGQRPRKSARASRSTRVVETDAVAAPRLEQFPSPQPLSQQERILASYVAGFQREATLMARAQTELLERDLAAFATKPVPPEKETHAAKSRTQ